MIRVHLELPFKYMYQLALEFKSAF